jgi:hypothetical protein
MRRRRFDRCIKTAETALESSDRTRFQEALEEATALFPDAPEVQVLGQRAAERARVREAPVAVVAAASVAQNIPPQSIPPPPLEPAADFTLRPMVERAPLFGSLSSPSYQEAPEPEDEASEPEYPTFSVQQKRSRSVAGPLLALVAVALFAVGGYAFTEYYLAQPQPASRTAAVRKTEPAPAPMTSEKPPAPTVAPTPAPPVVSRPDPPPPDPTRVEEAARAPETAPSQPKPAIENTAPRARAEDVARTSEPAARAMTVPATTPPPAPAPPPTASTTPASVASAPGAPASATPTSEPASSREASARETNPPPVTPVPTLPDSVATTGAGTAPSAAPAAAAEAARTDAGRPARPTPPRVDEEPQIRAVLARYESAYNRLDANAASNVYPGVNREALGRAFGGLISQRVSLGLCEITVAGDVGGASCNGKARWEPKVGSGARTADRHWKFNLRRDTEGWRIEQVVVR